MNRLQTWLWCLVGACSGLLFNSVEGSDTSAKKSLLVLSSVGGGGHIAACNTLEQLVGDEYELKVVYPINELRIWGVPSCEQVYNKMLKHGWIRSMNFIVRHVVPKIFRSRQRHVEGIVDAYIEANHPDLVVSLIPFINLAASEAARKRHLPFLVITTDNDLRNWVLDMQKASHPQMKITIGTELPRTKGLLLQKHIPEEAIETVGLPLRSEFRQHRDKHHICHAFSLPADKPRVLVMMGGAGGSIAYEYARRIARMPLGVHLMVIAGHNYQLRKELEALELDSSNSVSVFGYTDRVAELMQAADLIITKPGPGTINEAMAMKLPILIDNTGVSLFWERTNVDIVLQYQIGERIRRFDQLEEILVKYLEGSVSDSFHQVPANQFHLRVPQLIREMIAQRDDALYEQE